MLKKKQEVRVQHCLQSCSIHETFKSVNFKCETVGARIGHALDRTLRSLHIFIPRAMEKHHEIDASKAGEALFQAPV